MYWHCHGLNIKRHPQAHVLSPCPSVGDDVLENHGAFGTWCLIVGQKPLRRASGDDNTVPLLAPPLLPDSPKCEQPPLHAPTTMHVPAVSAAPWQTEAVGPNKLSFLWLFLLADLSVTRNTSNTLTTERERASQIRRESFSLTSSASASFRVSTIDREKSKKWVTGQDSGSQELPECKHVILLASNPFFDWSLQ